MFIKKVSFITTSCQNYFTHKINEKHIIQKT